MPPNGSIPKTVRERMLTSFPSKKGHAKHYPPANGDGAEEVPSPSSVGEDENDEYLKQLAAKVDKEIGKPNLDPLPLSLADIPGLRQACEHHKNDMTGKNGKAFTPETPKAPAPDHNTRLRATAKLLGFLQHDTPERRTLLANLNLTDDLILAKWLGDFSHHVLQETDRSQELKVSGEGVEDRPLVIDRKPFQETLPPEDGSLDAQRLSSIQAREVAWLWHQRIPLGELTLISGPPDVGKTWLVLDVIARVTSGSDFPDSPNQQRLRSKLSPRRDALWVSAEDSDATTIKPRLLMVGGDDTRVFSFRSIKKGKREESLDLSRHLDELDEWLTNHPLCQVVALDPLAAFLGKTNTHVNSEVRSVLTPIKKLAEKHQVAIIGINHFHKGEASSAINRGMGSIAFVAAARSSWQVTCDPNEPSRRLFTKAKGNLMTEDVGGLAFRLIRGVPKPILWEKGTVDMTADEALATASAPKVRVKDKAKDWLRNVLQEGRVLAQVIKQRAKDVGIGDSSLKTAKKELGVIDKREGGKEGKYWWSLPETGSSGPQGVAQPT